MRVVCDNCGATYRIPDEKLRREVNKATCRRCENPIIIRLAGGMAVGTEEDGADPEAATQISELAELQAKADREAREEDAKRRESELAATASPFASSFEQAMGVDEQPVDLALPAPAETTIPRVDMGVPTVASKGPPPSVPPTAAPSGPPMPDTPPPVVLPIGSAGTQPGHHLQGIHDPSSDFSVVMMVNFVAVFGALLLAIATQDWQRYGGLLVTLWGVTTSLLVVITSNRGRRDAQVVLSLFVGLMVSGVLSWGFYWNDSYLSRSSTVAVQIPPPPAPPVVAMVEDLEEEVEANSEEELEVEEGGPAEADGLSEQSVGSPRPSSSRPSSEEPSGLDFPRPASNGSSGSSSSRGGGPVYPSGTGTSVANSRNNSSWDDDDEIDDLGSLDDDLDDLDDLGSLDDDLDDLDDVGEPGSASKSRSRERSRSSSADRSTPEPTVASAPSSSRSASTGVAPSVLDTMLRNNRDVKGCFVAYRNETGSLPSGRIPVKIRIRPSGSPDRVFISGGTYQNTSLDDCLSSAIRSIRFPPFDGETKTYSYPFTL